jgi:proteasome lid subunit RPN8/RPN11
MRGTFVFPAADTDFMQLLEIRGNNGATADVETVFVLASDESYCVPTRLFAFDDPRLYKKATDSRVNVDNEAVARTVATFYEKQSGPRLITRVHTHPSGETTPSQLDQNVGPDRYATFNQYFDDYEFFLGIHALKEPCDPDPGWLRRPEQTAEHEVTWWGENRKHTLALYDPAYEPAPVIVQ